MNDLKGAQVDVNLELHFFIQAIRHSPRMPTGAASPKLKLAGADDFAGPVDYGEAGG
jgi:hypothetical protein